MTRDVDIYNEIYRISREVYTRTNSRPKNRGLQEASLSTLYSLRMGATKQGDSDLAAVISLEIIEREIQVARSNRTPKAHAKVIFAVISLLRQAASVNRGTHGSAKAMSEMLLANVNGYPKWLQQYLKNAPKSPRNSDVVILTGLSRQAWNEFAVQVVEATTLRTSPASFVTDEEVAVGLNVASRLSRLASKDVAEVGAPPSYDLSDKEIKIVRVTVEGFRGSAASVHLEMSQKNQPVDVLLWGDNGVGKSTLVDGIEFALQRRVDRSSDFNSSLRSSVRNLTVPTATAEVELSDGSVIQRSLTVNKAGRDVPSTFDVRPGFRIAPVVIRRADILRFLDTDALARGTVFFDYFPDPAGVLGTRPDEELRQLEEERFLVRVARDDLAAQLEAIYPNSDTDFSDSQQLNDFVGRIISEAEPDDSISGFDLLPREIRRIISELQAAQTRGSQIKNKLARGVETLNPVVYRSQLERIVPILRTVTADLTESFKRIARAEHVDAIRVLVGKSGPVSLDVVVEFDNGTSALPQQVFSEGYKDLIALLFFLTVTKKAAEFGQAKVLILDDALQSVDASVRLGLMDYVLEEFKGWQLIVTGHDRAWLAQLRGLFQRNGRTFVERSIVGWSFLGGLEVSGATHSRADSLRESIVRIDERMVAAGTGLLLEEVCNELSWRLGTSVIRRQGDRYTLGDLWPGVAKAFKGTSLKPVVDAINMRLDIRNLLGAHYNEWADGIAWSDIKQLGEDVLHIYDATLCSNCATWVTRSGGKVACKCGLVSLN